jgi:hypothetical protein
MNERYLGDGPGGQTRKSAASAKPKSSAASSVYIKKKPQTAQEKRAAAKVREKEERIKAQEKARKAAEKAKLAEAEKSADDGEAPKEEPRGFLSKVVAPNPAVPQTEEYQKWRRIYWILVIIGIICIVVAFVIQTNPNLVSPTILMVVLGVAYPAIIGALIIDFRKVKPLMRAHQNSSSANKSPKQLKHEQEAKEQAAAMEAARKAAKAAKRTPRRKKDSETVSLSEEAAVEKDSETVVPGEK